MAAALLAGLVALVMLSYYSAPWCTECQAPAPALALGAVYGGALVVSRFRARTAALLSIVMALLLAAFGAGRVFPSPGDLFGTPLSETGWLMHVRLLAHLAELGRVLAAAPAFVRGDLRSTGAYVFAMSVIAWSAGAWLVWCALRRRRALAALLPAALLLIVNSTRAGGDPAFPWPFVALSVLLVARTAMVDRQAAWEERHVDYPELIGENWALGAAGATALLTAVVVLTTPDTWRSLRDLFTVRAVQVVPAAGSTPGPGVPTASPVPVYRLELPDMRSIGDPVPGSLSQATMMWVQVSDPPPAMPSGPVSPAPPQHYWRGAVFAIYNGTGWEPLEAQAGMQGQATSADAEAGRYLLRQSFDLQVQHDENLFSVNNPVSTSAEVAARIVAPDGTALVQGQASAYDITSLATRASSAQLLVDMRRYPPEILEDYLQLPATVPARVRDLASHVVEGVTTPYEKATRVQDYLRTTYQYMLDVPRAPAGQDLVDYFLFDAPGGYCSYYASSMVVMLRAVGVPARLATGFATGEYDLARGAYRVPASAAHAWVEVYFPSYGWVEFEPTASRSAFDYAALVTPTPQPPAPITIAIPVDWPRVQETVLWSLVVILPVAAIWAAWRLSRWRRERRSLSGRQARARDQYWQLRRALARIGMGAPPSLTPGEYFAATLDRLAGRPRLQVALERSTALYVAAMFSTALPHPADLDAGAAAWRRAWREYATLWARRRIADRRIA